MQLGREIFYNLYTIWDAHSGTPYTHSRSSVGSVRDAVSVVGASINTVLSYDVWTHSEEEGVK